MDIIKRHLSIKLNEINISHDGEAQTDFSNTSLTFPFFHLRTEAVRQSNQDLSTGNRFLFSVQIFIKSVFDALGRKGRFPEWHFLMHNSFFSVGRTSNVGAATSDPTSRPRRHSFEIRRSKVNEC